MTTEFGERLRSARQAAGLSQKALAASAGMGQSAISSLEKIGHGSAYVYQLSVACGVNPEWLSRGEGPREPTTEQQKVLPPPAPTKLSATAVELARFWDVATADLNVLQREKLRNQVTTLVLNMAPGFATGSPPESRPTDQQFLIEMTGTQQ